LTDDTQPYHQVILTKLNTTRTNNNNTHKL